MLDIDSLLTIPSVITMDETGMALTEEEFYVFKKFQKIKKEIIKKWIPRQ